MELVQEIGSYAGIAGVVGLAVLSALYFSQARDVKRLREWAGRAPERTTPAVPAAPRVVAKPQAKPAAAKPGAPVAKPAPAAAKAAGTTPGAVPAAKPATAQAATAGAAAATAKAATPAVTKVGPAAATPAGAGKGAPPAPPEADEDGAAPDGEESEEKEAVPTSEAAADAPAVESEAPAQAEEAEEAEESAEPAVPAPATAAANGPKAPPKIPAPPPRVPSSPTARRPTIPPRPPQRAGRSKTMVLPPPRAAEQSRFRRLLASPRYLVLVLAGILILGGAAAFGVTQLGGDGGTTEPKGDAKTPDSGGGETPKKGAPVNPAAVTVSVLNGTTVPGLAAQIGDRLEGQGFKLGNITNSTDQARNESVVLFAPGHEREAKEVARRLRIPQREPIDPESQNLAGDATVVVVAGADQTQ